MSRVVAKPERLALWRTYLRSAAAVLSVTAGVLLGGCQTHPSAPIVQKSTTPAPQPADATPATPPAPPSTRAPDVHVVARGDTLHAIAWRYGLDSRDLVRWNRLANPDLIYVGQRLRLIAPQAAPVARAPEAIRPKPTPRPAAASAGPASTGQASTGQASTGQASAGQTSAGQTSTGQTSTTPAAPVVAAPAAAIATAPTKRAPDTQPVSGWMWPAEGKVTRARSVSGTRGVEIRGQRGQDVRAAAGGTVVYSGSGLRGYGELIIVKHDETFLSAYAHNETRLVEEGQTVKGGQVIARMGDTEARDVMLHFEIRRNGKSTDPYQYLPKR